MEKTGTIDFAKLLGFETVGGCLTNGVDFQDQTISDKLGAKVGPPEPGGPVGTQLDCLKLLGFDTVASALSEGVDFQDQTLGDKLGAKVGVEFGPMNKG